MNEELITLGTLGTFGGAVFTVTLITQFLKQPIDLVTKVPTRWVVLLISWIVLIGGRAVRGPITADGLFLDALNGFLVALSAMGAHSVAKDNFSWK